ncbi:hypothetical protein AB0C51_00225 [Streptomyces pathocidini]|uniref:NAD-dependent epimerase/dehydratase family protein n=1 Tax=Streptomyces pathocidini TaxID=1650571 RepID=UPI0033CB8427
MRDFEDSAYDACDGSGERLMPELDFTISGDTPGNVRISGAVMSHPRRRESAESLIARAPEGLLRLALDPDPEGPPTALRSAMKAWSAVEPEATHHLVLQDDAAPCPTFFDLLEESIVALPEAAIAFFTSWNSRNGAVVRRGALLGARWARAAREYTPTVALLLPAEIARGFADYARRQSDDWPDDVVMQRYLRARGIPTYLTVPNLVEHDEFPSVARNDHHGLRRAACFPHSVYGGNSVYGGETSLGHGLGEFDVVPFFKHGIGQCAVRDGGDDAWTTVDSERYCGPLGFDLERSRKQLYEAAAESSPALASVRPRALEALWTTAALTGFLSRRDGGPPPSELHALHDAAVATIGPGGLCGEFGAGHLSALQPELAELAWKAVRWGAADQSGETAAKRAPKARKARIAVVGNRLDLARHIRLDLGHQGYAMAGELPGSDAVIHIGEPQEARSVAESAERLGIRHVVCVEIPPNTHLPTHPPAHPSAHPHALPHAHPHDTPSTHRPPHRITTVLRIGVPYGPGILQGNSLMAEFVENALLRRPIDIDWPPPYAAVQYLHISDLCRAIERVLLLRKYGRYEICDEKPVGPRELARAVCGSVRPVPVNAPFPVDAPVNTPLPVDAPANAPTAAMPGAPRPGGIPRPMSSDKARAELGWRPVVPFGEGLRSFAQWLAYEAGPDEQAPKPEMP